MTVGDIVRSMSDKQLAWLISNIVFESVKKMSEAYNGFECTEEYIERLYTEYIEVMKTEVPVQ